MTHRFKPLAGILAAFALLPAATALAAVDAATTATASPGTLSFKAQNKVFKAEGQFKNWRFTKVSIPDGDLEKGTVEIEVDTLSVEANAERLTAHLKEDDMLKTSAFPKATIKLHNVRKGSDGTYTVDADLTLRGISKSVPAKFTVVGKDPLKVEGDAVINRLDHGVYTPYNPADERSVEPEVRIRIEATLPDSL